MPDNILSPKRITAEAFTEAAAAVARLTEIYERNVSFLRTAFEAYVGGQPLDTRVRATYPVVRITTGTHARLDFAPVLWLRLRPRHVRDFGDAAGSFSRLFH